jgi:hypothetical protein
LLKHVRANILSMVTKVLVMRDVSNAMDHLCRVGVVHRDLAARNILVRPTVGEG